MDHRGLRTLFVVHDIITLAAGVVLAVAPGLIPSVVGVHLDRVPTWSRIYSRALSSGWPSCRLAAAA